MKYRAKNLNGEWIFGYYFPTLTTYFITDGMNKEIILPETLGEYTGLIANKKEIYTGDIIIATAHEIKCGLKFTMKFVDIVVKCPGYYGFQKFLDEHKKEIPIGYTFIEWDGDGYVSIEINDIVGNIHTQKDLEQYMNQFIIQEN